MHERAVAFWSGTCSPGPELEPLDRVKDFKIAKDKQMDPSVSNGDTFRRIDEQLGPHMTWQFFGVSGHKP